MSSIELTGVHGLGDPDLFGRRGSAAISAGQLLRAVVEARGELWMRGAGMSMWPTVADGDEVLLVPLRRATRADEVVLVDIGPRLVLHRVMAVERGTILTIGDALSAPDAPVAADRLVARAVLKRARDGRATALLPTLRFGAGALVRWARARARLAAARTWRRATRAGGAPHQLTGR